MMIALYIVLSTIVFVLMYLVFRSRRGSSLPIRLEDINVSALANLMDPLEQQYLSEQLPSREYRRLHRKRMRVALAYLRELESSLPLVTDLVSHPTLSRARLLILQLRTRAILSFLLPNIKVKAAGLREVVANLVPMRG